MSWFDSISQFFGGHHDAAKAPAAAPAAPAAAPAAPATAPAEHGWASSGWANATGLGPWAELFGLGKDPPAKAGAAPAAGGSAATAPAVTAPAAASSGFKSNKVTGTGGMQSNGFEKDPDGGYKMPSAQNWAATGKAYGNRQDDQDAAAGGKGMAVTGPPNTYQPDLSLIPTKTTGQGTDTTGAGSFHDSAYGSYSGWTGLAAQEKNDKTGKMESAPDAQWQIDPATGKGGVDLGVGYQGQWGASEKGGWRASAVSKSGQSSANAEAGYVASGGASGSVTANMQDGIQATGGVGGKIGLYGNADANTQTGDVTVGGVKYNAGAGAHADAFVGAKAGASGTVGFGPDFIGAKGDIGAFAGAEANGDVHANLGPVGGKIGGSLMAGAGIGADGDISYKDGKFHVGGKMFAALGYGGSLSGDVTVDVGSIGKSAYALGKDGLNAVENFGSAAGTAISNGATAAYNEAGHLASEATGAISSTASNAYHAAGSVVDHVLSW